jgi:hypothetical protein
MIGSLPETLIVDSLEYKIRSDYHTALVIFTMLNDSELELWEKSVILLSCLFEDVPQNIDAALNEAIWFLDGGDMPKSKPLPYKLMDWEQDEQMLFSSVNKVAGYETRKAADLHWWTFLGFFNEIGEGLWSQVMNIRSKKAKGKKLEKHEQEFYKQHKDLVDLKKKYTAEEQAEMDRLNQLLG